MLDIRCLEQLHSVRRLRDMIREWWRIEVGFTDSEGYVADHAHGLVTPPQNAFCRAALGSSEGFRRCNQSVAEAVKRLKDASLGSPRAVRLDPCHLGFPLLFVPIIRQGLALGHLFVGGFLTESERQLRGDEIATHSQLLGLEVGSVVDAVDDIPLLTDGELQHLASLMELMAEEILLAPEVARALAEQAEASAEAGGRRLRFEDIIGLSPAMQELYALIERVAPTESTVLITGEDGTGKELVARAIHARGRRSEKSYVIRNCSAFNENLLESELFGHVRGAFTGAERDRMGVFEAADSGTLFLDEVGDTSPAMQVKLLRVLQEGTFIPVGSTQERTTNARLVAATNRPLKDMIRAGSFRKDLYYRLNVINLHLPPLRDRTEDLPHLCDHFLARLAERTGLGEKVLSNEVMGRFFAYDWPGNIRELQSEVERLYVLSGEARQIGPKGLSPALKQLSPGAGRKKRARLGEIVSNVERDVIAEGLIRTGWNKSQLATQLGISRTTLIRKIRDFGLEDVSPVTSR
jgi:transcriptional regulator with PAS, ATPase and Fis domain